MHIIFDSLEIRPRYMRNVEYDICESIVTRIRIEFTYRNRGTEGKGAGVTRGTPKRGESVFEGDEGDLNRRCRASKRHGGARRGERGNNECHSAIRTEDI